MGGEGRVTVDLSRSGVSRSLGSITGVCWEIGVDGGRVKAPVSPLLGSRCTDGPGVRGV
jgi:hypothetical protein